MPSSKRLENGRPGTLSCMYLKGIPCVFLHWNPRGKAPDISEEALQNVPSVSVFSASAQEFVQNPGGEGNRKDDGVKPDHLIGEHDGSVGAHVGGKADHHVQAAGAGGEIGAGDVEVAEFDDENGDEHPSDEHQCSGKTLA